MESEATSALLPVSSFERRRPEGPKKYIHTVKAVGSNPPLKVQVRAQKWNPQPLLSVTLGICAPDVSSRSEELRCRDCEISLATSRSATGSLALTKQPS